MTEGKYVSEQELNEKAVAPRVTLEAIEANIVGENYFTAYEGVLGERFYRTNGESDANEGEIPQSLKLTTYCVLLLRNGFTITGSSTCASSENYDKNIGERVARGDALRQIWPLMGYELRSRLHNAFEIGAGQDKLGEALTRMTAFAFGNDKPGLFRMADADIILAHFEKNDRQEEGGTTTKDEEA